MLEHMAPFQNEVLEGVYFSYGKIHAANVKRLPAFRRDGTVRDVSLLVMVDCKTIEHVIFL